MKKGLVIIGIIAMSFAFACKGGGKYAEINAAMNDMIDVLEAYTKDMEAAKSADDVVKAIENATAKMEKLKPRMDELEKKYPEVKNQKDEIPEELKESYKRMEEVTKKLTQVSMPLMVQYMKDPKVMEASRKMGEVFAK